MPNSEPCQSLLLFGATGDLSKRMLLPSLYGLHSDGLVPKDFRLIGTARSDLSDADFQTLVREALAEHLPDERRDDEAEAAFAACCVYAPADVSDGKGLEAVKARVPDCANLAIFLSTAPHLFRPTIAAIEGAGLAGSARICLEKPLGHDLESSRKINEAVAAVFDERRIFRVDHYLGKETVQNLLALRFANILFEPLWNSAHIEHVEITVAETVGLEGRAEFYDGVGALRDMVQNHMLQLLALTAMEPPVDYDPSAVRDEKVKVLRALEPPTADELVFGQYGEGASGGESVPSFEADLGQPSDTETFVALKAHVENWRWHGVPFYLRTGKRMTERRSEIVIQFKPVPHNIFAERFGTLTPNRLVIRLQPEEYVRMFVMTKQPGLDKQGVILRSVPLDLSLTETFKNVPRRIAYERLLLDLMAGDQTLFVRRDEVEAQWRWIDGIREIRASSGGGLKRYGAGSWGPAAAIALTARDGVNWND